MSDDFSFESDEIESEEIEAQEIETAVDKKVSEQELVEKYQKHFDKDIAMRLLVKLRKSTRNKPKLIAGATGAIVSTLGSLISALENPATPTHMRALIIGAIGYIVLPLDLIPDIVPAVGYTDDIASAAGVVAAVAVYSDFSLEKLDAYIDQLEEQK
ncbi:MAG: DUF1232 domain-containing protein [Spirochaetaceae bacterium]|nr:DUF1232 domain-containing protein [Spirochaetaceae bacterium]